VFRTQIFHFRKRYIILYRDIIIRERKYYCRGRHIDVLHGGCYFREPTYYIYLPRAHVSRTSNHKTPSVYVTACIWICVYLSTYQRLFFYILSRIVACGIFFRTFIATLLPWLCRTVPIYRDGVHCYNNNNDNALYIYNILTYIIFFLPSLLCTSIHTILTANKSLVDLYCE